MPLTLNLIQFKIQSLTSTPSNPPVWFHVVGVTLFVVLLPALAPTRASAAWVFGAFKPDASYTGISSPGFSFLLALLGSQWAMVGCERGRGRGGGSGRGCLFE